MNFKAGSISTSLYRENQIPFQTTAIAQELKVTANELYEKWIPWASIQQKSEQWRFVK